MLRPALFATAALLPLQAVAQDGSRFAFDLRAGVEARPGYFGSDEVVVGPDLSFSLDTLSLGALSFGGGSGVEQGLGFRGSFRFLPGRSADDYEELQGLEDVDAALELGGGLSYSGSWYEAFAVARYGVTGHESLVADIGLDVIARPSDRLTLRAGPRVFLGSDDFAATYFGVTPAEAGPSAFSAYEAEGGVLSTGVELTADYSLTDNWGIEGGIRYDRLRNDAADSPITTEDDQLSAFLGVTRQFDFAF